MEAERKMMEQLESGEKLIRQRRLDEAGRLLDRLAALRPQDPEPVRGLLRVAQVSRDFDLMVSHLDRWLELEPDSLYARATRAHVLARRGSLEVLRASIDEYLDVAEEQLPDIATLDRLLQVIQYTGTGGRRIEHLNRLRSVLERIIAGSAKGRIPHRVRVAGILLALGEYGDFVRAVRDLESRAPKLRSVRQLARIAEKCASPRFPDLQAPKVFGIGLSRTATSSLNTALGIVGLHAIHWLNPHTKHLITAPDFALFDAFTDIPVSAQFEYLYHAYPGARFIYTTRPIDSWQASIALHYRNNRKIENPHELARPDASRRFDHAMAPIEMSLYGRYDTWREAFEAYDRRVRDFFRDKPERCFLELSICEGEGWEKLCAFLGRPVPDRPFPNENQSPTFGEDADTT